MPRTLFIDADACPVTRESIDCARRAGVAVVIAGNSTQNLERHIRRDDPRDAEHARRGFWVTTLDVSVGADSADFAIVERLQAGDVVVTQDIGLASMVLGRDAAAIGVRGRVYDKATIDMQLFIRHEEKKVRRAGGRTRGPAAFTSEDRARFKRNLTELLHQPRQIFGTLPKIYLFVLGSLSARNPWLNKKTGFKMPCVAALRRRRAWLFEAHFLGLLRGRRRIG